MDKQPIVVGLAGKAGSGKSTVANAIAPIGQVLDENTNIMWTHLYYAIPLYRMATTRQKIEGMGAASRQSYEIHDVLRELFGTRLDYEELVDLVYEVMATPCEPDGVKPRSFMQQVGTRVCRGIDEHVFVRWMKHKIAMECRIYDYPETVQQGIVISDARFYDECELIKSYANSKLIRLDVSPTVAAARIAQRDQTAPDPEMSKHISENSLLSVPDDWYDAIIDTDGLSVKEQILAVKNIINPPIHPSIHRPADFLTWSK